MPTVSCPACSTARSVESGAGGYTCESCGQSWVFVTCQTCGSRFHSRPGSPGWTCPNCGTQHGSVAKAAVQPPSLAVKGDDLDSAAREPLGGPQTPFETPETGSPYPMPRRADRRGSIPSWAFVAVGAVVVIVVAFLLINRGGDDPGDLAPTGAAAAKEQACSDVRQLATLRTDALQRAQDDLKADAKELQRAGDAATAKKVKKLAAAVGDYRVALEEQRDTAAASDAMGKAIEALDC